MTTNETIKVLANQSKRTFTIRTFDEQGEVTSKYRTINYSQEEFDSMEFNTPADWKHFLSNCDEYFLVK